jgi:hypothetical protein
MKGTNPVSRRFCWKDSSWLLQGSFKPKLSADSRLVPEDKAPTWCGSVSEKSGSVDRGMKPGGCRPYCLLTSEPASVMLPFTNWVSSLSL